MDCSFFQRSEFSKEFLGLKEERQASPISPVSHQADVECSHPVVHCGSGSQTWMSASETPKSRLETRSFPPVSTPAPLPPPTVPLKPPKPLSNMSCCHLSGSCLGCNRWERTHLLTSGSPCLCQSQSPHGWVLGQAVAPLPTGTWCSAPPWGSPIFPSYPITTSNPSRQKNIQDIT